MSFGDTGDLDPCPVCVQPPEKPRGYWGLMEALTQSEDQERLPGGGETLADS